MTSTTLLAKHAKTERRLRLADDFILENAGIAGHFYEAEDPE